MAMNDCKNKAGGHPALTDEERLLISRAAELSDRAEYSAVASCFLTPRQQRILFECGCGRNGFFYGGALGATRRKLVFLPQWMESDLSVGGGTFSPDREKAFEELIKSYGIEDDIRALFCPVHLVCSGYESLSHRDWLGAVMGLGLKRETVGDICFFEGEAYMFCDEPAAKFLSGELTYAGRDKVRAEICPLPEGFVIENKFEEIYQTVASPRLDGVVRALLSISRDAAAALVESGSVELNYFTEERVDAKISNGDILSVRGYGKFVVDSADTLTKKGRYRLAARKYI